MTLEKPKGQVRIFACGGAGTNIGKHLEKFRGTKEAGMAQVEVTYIDTSRSNLSDDIPEEACYLLKDMDGSGKIRKENYEAISTHTRDILQKHHPEDLAIVISSAAGGSGSVIAPSLVSELLDRDAVVVTILIGATDTRLEIENTLKTLKSYEAIGRLREKPVVLKYLQNSKETPRAAVNQDVLTTISICLATWSRENRELDSKDLYNFLNFHRPTTFKPQLASLDIYFNKFPEKEDVKGEVISVVSLLQDDTDSDLPIVPDYQCVGYMPSIMNERVLDSAPIHLVITTDLLAQAAKVLNTRMQELEQAQKARVATVSILTDKDQATDSGLVL